MRVDLHSHSFYSKDSLSSFEAIIASVLRSPLDALALTDHDQFEGALEPSKEGAFSRHTW